MAKQVREPQDLVQLNIFGEEEIVSTQERKKRKEKFEDYDGFVNKFNPKKTTDDCYTPPNVYEEVLEYARSHCRFPDGARVVRPFYPGGDYENFEYQPGDVVVDNPPFSILSKIRRFYLERKIPYFLFAPALTLPPLNIEEETLIVTGCPIEYENGAKVPTSFVTNSWLTDDAVHVAGDLFRKIMKRQQKERKRISKPSYDYPANVISAARLHNLSRRGVVMSFLRTECHHIKKLDIQKGKAIFGSGFLISDRLAAERLAAERLAAERLAAERLAAKRLACKEKICFPLSEREKQIVAKLEKEGSRFVMSVNSEKLD